MRHFAENRSGRMPVQTLDLQADLGEHPTSSKVKLIQTVFVFKSDSLLAIIKLCICVKICICVWVCVCICEWACRCISRYTYRCRCIQYASAHVNACVYAFIYEYTSAHTECACICRRNMSMCMTAYVHVYVHELVRRMIQHVCSCVRWYSEYLYLYTCMNVHMHGYTDVQVNLCLCFDVYM